jgi:ABC-2 type transport system permease protein
MKVFNLYTKLLKRYSVVLIVYVVIFLVLSIILTLSLQQSTSTYTDTKVYATLDNFDEGSALSEGLIDYLGKYVVYRDIKEENRGDALYFRQISSIIIIPKDFEKDFLAGKDVIITQERIEENASSVNIDRVINKYLNYIRVYLNQTDKELSEIITLVDNVMVQEAEATTLVEVKDQLESSAAFYRVFSYIIMSCVLTVVGLITISFRKFDVRRRLLVSPYPTKNANLEMIFGNLLFTIGIVILLCGVSVILYPEVMLSKTGGLLTLNAFVFSLTALSMSYFMCLLIKNEEVLSGVNNVYSLGSAFLAGAFVPQILLSDGLLKFAHILPNYYYVYNADLITSGNNINSTDMKKFILYLIIQLIYAIAFVVFSVVLSKKQARAED